MMRFVMTLRMEDLVMREKEVSGNRGKEGGGGGGGDAGVGVHRSRIPSERAVHIKTVAGALRSFDI